MKSYYLLYILLAAVPLVSCSDENSKEGPDDNPILKQGDYSIPAKGDSIKIESVSYFFYIYEVKSIENNDTTTSVIDTPTSAVQNISGDWYALETSLNNKGMPNVINLKLYPNNSGLERILLLFLQRENNFETLIVKQEFN